MNKANQVIRAVRATIHLGDKPVEVFQMPDGEYQLSQTSTTTSVNRRTQSLSDFQRSKHPQALPFKSLAFQKCWLEAEKTTVSIVPIDYVIAYWTKEALTGNCEAIHLLAALAKRCIVEMCDEAFGVTRSTQERNFQLASNLSDETKQQREQMMLEMRLEELRSQSQQTVLLVQLSQDRESATCSGLQSSGLRLAIIAIPVPQE